MPSNLTKAPVLEKVKKKVKQLHRISWDTRERKEKYVSQKLR